MTLWWECMTLHEVCELYVVCAPFDHVCVICSWEGNFCEKYFIFYHGYIPCLYVLFYLVGDACAQIVAILIVYVSILAFCSVLCIFEKHIFAFVDLIHALPIRRRKLSNSCFQGEFCIKGRKNWEKCICSGGACIHTNAFVQGELAFILLGPLFRLNFSCALLQMVSSPFASPWGVGNFGAFYLGCVESLPLS
jgi:hypothetical protein